MTAWRLLKMLLAVIVVGPVLFLLYLFILGNTGPNRWAAAHHMLASGLIQVALGFMSGAMAARVLPRYLWWLPGLATAGLLIAGWAVLVHVGYPRGGGPALTDVLLLFRNLVLESALVWRYWAGTCLVLPVVGSLVGASAARLARA
jgi:hypothetical protein